MSRLLAIYGSPREGGNTDTLMDYFLEGVRDSQYDVERIYLRNLKLSHCNECDSCENSGKCIIQDDMIPLYDKLLDCERIVISLPVYFMGPPALTKAFIDRGQALWIRKYRLGIRPESSGIRRKGFLLSICGFKAGGKIFTCNTTIVRAFYITCGFRYAGELTFTGIDHISDLKSRKDVKESAFHAARGFINE